MSEPHSGARVLRVLAVMALVLTFSGRAWSDEPKPTEERRLPVAQSLAPTGMLLQRSGPNKNWQFPSPEDSLSSRDLLLALPGGRAGLDSSNGTVRLTLWGNLPQISSAPVLESAVVLHNSNDADLAFTLERGRVLLTQMKDKEAVRVHVTVAGQTWELTLEERGDEVALELYGRWPHGVPFTVKPTEHDRPTLVLHLLAVKGTATVHSGGRQFVLRAPPGVASFEWDSVAGLDSTPRRVDRLPAWADTKAGRSTVVETVHGLMEDLRQRLREKPIDVALRELRDTSGSEQRAALAHDLAVFSMGAVDDLPDLLASLEDAQHSDVRAAAVEALRAWIGRRPGQDQELYSFLTNHEKYSPTQAEIVLQLLHSPFNAEQPETYEALIAYLGHDRLEVRELARWHLYRLAPAGRDIAFNAAAPAEERTRAVQEWRRLIPEGKLPPEPKNEKP